MATVSRFHEQITWQSNRKRLEAIRFHRMSDFARRNGLVTPLDYFLPALNLGLKMSGLLYLGKKNALDLRLKEHELFYEHLPASFDGYRVLHLTDLHLDCLPGVEQVICQKLEGLYYDTCVMTGDYRWKSVGDYDERVLSPLKDIVACIQAKDGIYATLGNHDTCQIVEPLESMGVKVLNNESLYLQRGHERILLTGLDDPHTYYTRYALEALTNTNADFKLALIHSPELYSEAASCGYDLYLCGHTHGGQICLPGGFPLVTQLRKARHLYHGLWKYGRMTGYTSAGCGVSGLPVRFNSRGEITIFTLRRKK
jgi:predicted MPP superfamily phosphohydrolase